MPTIAIRNSPSKRAERLKGRAERQDRSMEREVREILGSQLMGRDELLGQIQARWPHLPEPPSTEEVTGWIKAARGDGQRS